LDEREKNFELAARLFREHEAFIRSVIRFALRDPSEADDFFQELFLSLALNFPSEEIKSPRGYLYRLIMERAYDWGRTQARRKKRLRQVDLDADPPSDHKAAEVIVSQGEEARILFQRIQEHLRRNEARAILYRYKHDYTLEETAEKMGIKPRTVIRYVCTGLKKIRELVNKKESEEQS
jgi:RNA polymerase sigma factor (sigma-70 family)